MAYVFIAGYTVVLVDHQKEDVLREPAYSEYSNNDYHHFHNLEQ